MKSKVPTFAQSRGGIDKILDENELFSPLPESQNARRPDLPLASRWLRFQGAFVDALISAVVIIPLAMLTGDWQQMMSRPEQWQQIRQDQPQGVMSRREHRQEMVNEHWQQMMSIQKPRFSTAIKYAFFSVAAFILLNGYLLSRRGQTIGKAVVGTKIVDLDGNTPVYVKLLMLRYLPLFLLGFLPYCLPLIADPISALLFLAGVQIMNVLNLLCIFGKQRRCIHDYLAGTQVINLRAS